MVDDRRVLWALSLLALLAAGCAGTAPLRTGGSTPGFGPVDGVTLAAADSAAVGGSPESDSGLSPVPAAPQSYARSGRSTAPGGIYTEAFWVPAAFVTLDTDGDLNAPNPKLETGQGFGVGAGVSNGDQGVGLLYIGTFHDNERTSGSTEMHSFLADFRARGLIWHEGDNDGYLHFTAGGGVTDIQTPTGFRNETEGIIQMRGLLELEFNHRFSFHLGGGGFLFGHPGETVGYGSWVMAGGGLRF